MLYRGKFPEVIHVAHRLSNTAPRQHIPFISMVDKHLGKEMDDDELQALLKKPNFEPDTSDAARIRMIHNKLKPNGLILGKQRLSVNSGGKYFYTFPQTNLDQIEHKYTVYKSIRNALTNEHYGLPLFFWRSIMNKQVGLFLNRINVKENTNECSKDTWIQAQAALLEEWELGDFPTMNLQRETLLGQCKEGFQKSSAKRVLERCPRQPPLISVIIILTTIIYKSLRGISILVLSWT